MRWSLQWKGTKHFYMLWFATNNIYTTDRLVFTQRFVCKIFRFRPLNANFGLWFVFQNEMYSIQTRFQGFWVKLGRVFLKESPGDEVDRNIDHFLSVYFDTSFENLVTDKSSITDNFLSASYTLLSTSALLPLFAWAPAVWYSSGDTRDTGTCLLHAFRNVMRCWVTTHIVMVQLASGGVKIRHKQQFIGIPIYRWYYLK